MRKPTTRGMNREQLDGFLGNLKKNQIIVIVLTEDAEGAETAGGVAETITAGVFKPSDGDSLCTTRLFKFRQRGREDWEPRYFDLWILVDFNPTLALTVAKLWGDGIENIRISDKSPIK